MPAEPDRASDRRRCPIVVTSLRATRGPAPSRPPSRTRCIRRCEPSAGARRRRDESPPRIRAADRRSAGSISRSIVVRTAEARWPAQRSRVPGRVHRAELRRQAARDLRVGVQHAAAERPSARRCGGAGRLRPAARPRDATTMKPFSSMPPERDVDRAALQPSPSTPRPAAARTARTRPTSSSRISASFGGRVGIRCARHASDLTQCKTDVNQTKIIHRLQERARDASRSETKHR